MANPGYVRSTDGNNADDGSTWALANATFSGAITDAAAGDTIYVSQAHEGTYTSATTLTFPGTKDSPNFIICGNDAAEPPTSTSTTGKESTTNTSILTINGSFYCYGMTFESGYSNVGALVLASADTNHQTYQSCNFALTYTVTGNPSFAFGSGTGTNESALIFRDCQFKFGHASQGAGISAGRKVEFLGGGIQSGSAAITTLFKASAGTIDVSLTNFDFSNAASTLNIWAASEASSGRVTLQNCKLPAAWSGSLMAGAPSMANFRASMYNCDNADTHYKVWIETYAGTIRDETTLTKSGGASDGSQALSWKLTTTANATEYIAPLISDPIAVWNTAVGSSKTLTIDILHDSVTNLTDAEVWVEVTYLGTSGVPLGAVIDDHRALLASAAAQTTSAATWTTTGMANPNTQKLEVTFTPQEYGVIMAKVYLAKPSYTIYVDPEITLS